MEDKRSNKRKESKKEFSAGGIVFKREGDNVSILVIKGASGDRAKGLKEVWSFPKGWIGDHGEETLEEGALREVREEGGVVAEIRSDLGEVSYSFIWQEVFLEKTVRWFLMEYTSGNPKDHDTEVAEAKFIDLSEVSGFLTYPTDQEVFARAKEILLQKQPS